MDDTQIQLLIAALDTRGPSDEEAAWARLKPLGMAVVPHLAAFYPKARKWQGRASLVFHCLRYARESDAAFGLGLAALHDQSTMVRHRACSLCAYSLRREAIPSLKAVLGHHDSRTVADALAAIDAIEHRNHHYFYDRTHSGKSFWVVNAGDQPIAP